MFIEFRCRCGHGFRTHTQNVGKQITCPNCLTQATVPDPNPTFVAGPHSVTPPLPPSAKEVLREQPATPSRLESSAVPSLQKVEKNAVPKSASQPIAKRSKSGKSPHNTDDLFDLSDIGSMEAPEEDDELADVPSSPRKKQRAKNDDEEGDSNVRKGKKKFKKPKRGKGENLPLIVGGVVAVVLVLGSIGFFAVPALIAAVKDGGKIKLPQEFDMFDDNEIHFRCEYPKGWEAESRGGTGNIPPSVRIAKGRVKISYRASNSGAAIQDMAQAGSNAAGELSDELKPVARVHDFQRDKFSAEMPNYKEMGDIEKIDTGWGEGRLSTFTASGDFGTKVYGYRITLLTTMFQWNVVCTCSTKREFDAYKPVFRRIIESTGTAAKSQ